MSYETSLRLGLEGLELPPAAVDYLMALWNVIQVLDDVADGDEVARPDLDRAIADILFRMPSNEFYRQFHTWLVPALAQMVMKWQASDIQERMGEANAQSYMWRAGYYDVVLLVVTLCHGPSSDKALQALRLYGETVEEYMREFGNA